MAEKKTQPAAAPAPQKSGSNKTLMIVLIVIGVLLVLSVGSCVACTACGSCASLPYYFSY